MVSALNVLISYLIHQHSHLEPCNHVKTVKVLCEVHPALQSWNMDSIEYERKTTERIWNVVAQTYDACRLDEAFVEWKRP